jgi:hypothetical protein
MDWFERLTGFRETSYHDTRAKLKVDGSRLKSLINGKDYGIGELELVSLQALRERVQSGGGLPGRLKASVVTGDVRQMHQSTENAGAVFQVASQFNLLEMVSPTVTPEHGDMAAMSVLAKMDSGLGTERRTAVFGSTAARLLKAYAMQMEVLRRLRTGGQQVVRVERVHVSDGGQAVIGNVNGADSEG